MTFNQIKKAHVFGFIFIRYFTFFFFFLQRKKEILFSFFITFFLKKKTMSKLGTDENPIDTSYYELLDVSPTADGMQIKKAYRLVIFIKINIDRSYILSFFLI
jgi:hypothetical protein